MKRVDPKVESLIVAIESAPRREIIVYHEGKPGSLPRNIAEAARKMYHAGKCTLAQRPTKLYTADGQRIWQWVAITC